MGLPEAGPLTEANFFLARLFVRVHTNQAWVRQKQQALLMRTFAPKQKTKQPLACRKTPVHTMCT